MRRSLRDVDGAHLEALLAVADQGESALLAVATRSVTALLGERGSCILVDGQPRVMFATHAPELTNWHIELARYPEIVSALELKSVVAVEDVRGDSRLDPVRSLLPPTLRLLAAVPLCAGERRLGALMVQSRSVRRMSPRSIATAQLLGRLTAHLLEAARLRRAAAPAEPANPEERPPVSALTLPPPAQQSNGRRVLVVEDEQRHSLPIEQMLAWGGYQVQVARDDATAVKLAHEAPPDLILMDVSRPLLDLPGAAQQLERDSHISGVPILFVAGCDELMVRVRGFALGAVDFLATPFHAPELLARVERLLEQADTREELRSQAIRDELTGLGNLRFLHERLAVEQSRSIRYGTPLAMVMIDVDGLKQINDRHGHDTGSRALQAVARVVSDEIRGTDVAVRYGGDEFVVVLPHAGQGDGMAFAKRVLAQVRRLDGPRVTVSVGVASLSGSQPADALLQAADAAAYRAKRLGGDRACSHAREVSRPEELGVLAAKL